MLLSLILVAIYIILIIPQFLLYRLAEKANRKYKLIIFKIKELVAILSIIYLTMTLISNLSSNAFISLILFNLSIIVLTISALLLFIYFYALLEERITIGVIVLCGIIVLIKMISLVIEPISIIKYQEIYLREAQLGIIGVTVASLIIILILIELIRLNLQLKEKIHYRRYSRILTGVYSIIVVMIPTFVIGEKYFVVSLIIPYLQGILISIITLYLILYFKNNPERLVLLPIKVKGFLLHTYGGLAIIKKEIDPAFDRLIALSSALIASLSGLEQVIDDLKKPYAFRTYNLIDSVIIVLFGKITIGALIVNKDNQVVRDILRRMILEFENELREIDEGMITNLEVNLAEEIFNKYIEFLL